MKPPSDLARDLALSLINVSVSRLDRHGIWLSSDELIWIRQSVRELSIEDERRFNRIKSEMDEAMSRKDEG